MQIFNIFSFNLLLFSKQKYLRFLYLFPTLYFPAELEASETKKHF